LKSSKTFIKGIPSLLLLFFLIWLIRFLLALGVYLYELTGSLIPPFPEFLWTQLWQIGETLAITLIFALITKVRFLKLPIYIFLYILCILLVFWAIADPIVFFIAGDHITPSLFSHFAGPRILLSDDLWLPIKKHAIFVIPGLFLLFFVLLVFFKILRGAYYERYLNIKLKPLLFSGLVSIALMCMPNIMGFTYLNYPAEILYIRDYFGLNRYLPKQTDIDSLRNSFNPSIKKDWISDKYPLLHKNKDPIVNKTQPDIILIVIESLRARSIKVFSPKTGDLNLFALEKISKNGVIFPYFISNGFPSSEGFFSLLTGTWPHSRKRIAQNYRKTEFDNLATHLGRAGYKSVKADFNLGSYGEGFWVKKYYMETISFSENNIFPSEKNMVAETIRFIRRHDSVSKQPLFIHFKTKTPHYPYNYPNDETLTFDETSSPSKNYKIGMEYVDVQLGKLYDFLHERERDRKTVIIVVGDHANYLDKSLATALPVDDVLWTGAIVSGSEALVGKPRIKNVHCSQIDIMPTILYLSGDTSPRVTLGRNLLDDDFDETEAFSIAVRPSGVRIDKGGFTYIVDRRHPSQFIKLPAFEGLMHLIDGARVDMSPQDVLKIADSWSYLIEENRVWAPDAVNEN
jgi:phosphoglycerol transferase MdoB-like AlkP superfamily enzyme